MTWDVSALSYDSLLFTPAETGTLDLQGFALRPNGQYLYIINEEAELRKRAGEASPLFVEIKV